MRRPARPLTAGMLLLLGAACAPPAPPADSVSPPDPRTDDPAVVAQFGEARRLLAAGRLGEAGRIYHAYSRRDAAAAAYRSAVDREPRRFVWRYLLATVERDSGNDDAAVRSLEQALEIRPGEPTALRLLAEIHLDRNEIDAARLRFEELLRARPDSPTALAGIGRVALAAGDAARAVEFLERALAAAPEATALHYPLGLAYREAGNTERAAALLARRGDLPPPFSDPHIDEVRAIVAGVVSRQNRGMELLRRGRTSEAVEEFRASSLAEPDDPRLIANLGHALVQDGRPAEALDLFAEALRLDPGYVTARFNRGAALAALGRDEEAAEEYRLALGLDPALVAARFNLGNALRRLGRNEEALPEFAEALRLQPDHAGARLAEVLTLIRLDRYREAARRLSESSRALPDDEALLHVRVRLLAAAPDDAVRDGRLAAELGRRLRATGGSYEHALTMAMVAAENGDFAGASELQRRVLAAVEGKLPSGVVSGIRTNLRRYERNEPCRLPWRSDDPLLSPSSATGSQ